MGSAHGDDIARLCDEVRALLDAPFGPRDDSLEALEHMLTDGYARALALEAEQRRLERRMAEVGADVRGGCDGAAEHLAGLAVRLAIASTRLLRLRALLASLRQRANAAREARSYAVVEDAGR